LQVVPTDLAHVPFAVGLASQALPAAQLATPQQTPSTQKPVPQSLAFVQALPRPSVGTQVPALQ
jgi:hypothetical protein